MATKTWLKSSNFLGVYTTPPPRQGTSQSFAWVSPNWLCSWVKSNDQGQSIVKERELAKDDSTIKKNEKEK